MTTATLDQYHAAIKAALEARLAAGAVTVTEYNPHTENLPTPGVLINLDEAQEDPNEDAGDGLLIVCTWSLYCVLGRTVPNVERDVRNFALEVMRIIRKARRFGFDNIGRAEYLAAMPAAIKPGSNQYESWVITWEQIIELPAIYDEGELVPFLTFHADHEQADDAPVASDTVTLPQP